MKRRVVITGIGAITPIGIAAGGLWDGLRARRSAVRELSRFDPSVFRSRIAAEVNDFVPTDHLEAKRAKRLDRFGQFSVATTRLAIADAQLDLEHEDKERIGAMMGTALGGGGEAGQRARCDAVHEDRTDHRGRGEDADERPARAVPRVHDAHARAVALRSEGPFDVHALGDTPDVTESDRRRRVIHAHLRTPPRRPAEDAERAPRRHLDHAAAVARTLAEPHPAIVREMRRPMLDVACQREDVSRRRAHEALVHGLHGTAGGHHAEREGLAERGAHDVVPEGDHAAVVRNPKRSRTSASRATASRTSARSSRRRNPRSTETTPSCRL